MAAIEVISGFTTAPGAVETAATMASGDTSTVRNFSSGYAYLLNTWVRRQGAGFLRIKSPRLHDNVNGIRLDQGQSLGTGSTNEVLLPQGFVQPLIAQDQLAFSMTGTATASAIEAFATMLYYPNLDSANGRFIDNTQLAARLKNITGYPVSVTAGTTGGWSGAAALNSLVDTLKANTDYAVIGATVRCTSAIADFCAVSFKGVDTGNLRIAVPGNPQSSDMLSSFFTDLTDRAQKPMVPVINSANKAGIQVEVVNDNAANTILVAWILGELA